MTILLGLFLASGLLLSGLSLPLILRKVGPNSWYGFRVRRTLDDPAVWYEANAIAAQGLLGVGLSTCVVALALYFVPGIDIAGYASIVAAVVLGGLALNLWLSFRYLKTIARRDETA